MCDEKKNISFHPSLHLQNFVKRPSGHLMKDFEIAYEQVLFKLISICGKGASFTKLTYVSEVSLGNFLLLIHTTL
jgi:hypothetical protein